MTAPVYRSHLGAALLRGTGALIAATQRQRGLVVVNYHRVLAKPDPMLESEPDVVAFRWQMALLARCFNVLPLHDALRALDQGTLPPRAVCITFDDGYRSVHDLALPVLRELGLPATVFVTSGFIGPDVRNMWNDRIIHALHSMPYATLDLEDLGLGVYSLASMQGRQQTMARIIETVKYLPPEARHALVERLDRMCGRDQDPLMLTPAMLAELDRSGIEIGAHTVSHPILTSLDDQAARFEISEGKKQLEAMLGKQVRLFAYPNGKVGKDYDARHVEMVREAGFTAAFTTAIGAVTRGKDRFQLPRSRPWDRTPLGFGLRLLSWIAQGERAAPAVTTHQEDSMHKRALLIAFHFPPQAGSSGIQRTLSFSRNLDAHGWEPIVMSANPRAYARQNPAQLASVPQRLLVERPFALDAKLHLGFRGRYPSLLALPDRWSSWWFGAVPAGLRLVRRQQPRLIWSTFPIASAHLIGLTLKRLTGLPWVADFRDPMVQSSYPVGRLPRALFAWIERQTIERCSKAVFTTESALQSYRTRFPGQPADKFVVIENGYDEDSFAGAGLHAAPSAAAPGGPLTLLHSGVLYDTGRDPSAFLDALSRLKRAGTIDGASLRVVLRAPGNVEAVTGLIERYGVADIACALPPVPYQDALREMLAADGLLVFQGTPFNSQLPAKVYEYFRARKPLFGLVDRNGETARVLSAAGFTDQAEIGDAEHIAGALERFLAAVRSGEAHVATPELIARSSRAHRAHQLAAVFDEILEPAPHKLDKPHVA
ncbi:polysaccharide deacetylase family protein [Massilia sp. HP4]|uniref:polysaccharide deacetylase family protein n=1 Tax=Massilia sp. HP4 TaxID=2562316 RepID=UPI001E4D2A99|nr:polysaccharide deacetylase family protein [Massilia sp. HP4]